MHAIITSVMLSLSLKNRRKTEIQITPLGNNNDREKVN